MFRGQLVSTQLSNLSNSLQNVEPGNSTLNKTSSIFFEIENLLNDEVIITEGLNYNRNNDIFLKWKNRGRPVCSGFMSGEIKGALQHV